MMKKGIAFVVVIVMLLSAACAETLSPTTGLPLDGEPTAPMLAVISHAEGSTEVNGKTVKAAGVGKRQPWGAQQADLIYESILYQDGCSRFVYLYHDALVRGEAISAGPIRSVRSVHIDLCKAWNAGLIFSAGTDRSTPALPQVWDRCYSLSIDHARPYFTNVKRKAPDCRSADVTGMHSQLKNKTFTGTGFAFTDDAPDAALPSGRALHINWGDDRNLKLVWSTHLTYDAETGKYLCFSGKAPLKTFHDATFTAESQLAFDNVIVQYAAHDYPVNRLTAEVDMLSGGKAVLLRGGKRLDGRWVNENGQIRFVDETGAEMPLSRGKTYIAIWGDGIGEISWE